MRWDGNEMKIIRLSIANIKKHKKESILLGILIAFCTILFAAALSAFSGIKKITPDMAEKTGCFRNFVTINQKDYSSSFLAYFEGNPEVEKYDHVSMANGSLKINDKSVDMSFVSVNGEKKLEKFDVDTTFSEAELAEISHPIYLDRSNRDELSVDTGDTLTAMIGKKEYSYTVAGFYDSGIWVSGTKAVVSEDDLEILLDQLGRAEVIGFNTVDGTDNKALLKDFTAYAKDISVNDITASLVCSAYENILETNKVNMSLLSIIIMIMAGVIVLAVLVMIRFRIVSDINEQLVSIGVLEAIGYTSGEITLSYIFEYVLIAACGVIISIVPSVLMTGFLMKNAASTIHYGGEISTAVLPIVLVAVGILIFVALIAMTKARSVRKYPPVLAFRKGIQAHHFKKTYLPLEKTRGNVHVRLAMKGFLQNVRQSFGLTVCIIAATIMVVISFMIGSFFSDEDKIVNGVCGHELSDIRIETAGGVDHESFREELQGLEGVKKVLMVGGDIAVTYPDENEQTSLEVYKDYSETESLSVTEGRFPIHDNEVVVTLQVKKRVGLSEGDTVRIEYGKVVRDYIVTGFVNSAIEPNTSYMTETGFKRIYPSYTSNTFDIYLKEDVDKEAFRKVLNERYGENVADIADGVAGGDSLEERIKKAAEIRMAKFMKEEGISYMEYAVKVGDKVISGSTSIMKIKSITYISDEYKDAAESITSSFSVVSIALMIASAIVVTIILSILMASTIRKQYRELGVMKGLGYTSRELKFQMAFRIFPPTLFAVIVGSIISVLLLGVFESFVARITVSLAGLLITDLIILLFCFASAYIAARKIRKISVYELMTE